MRLKIKFVIFLFIVITIKNLALTSPPDSTAENFLYKLRDAIENQQPANYDKFINNDSLISRVFNKLHVPKESRNTLNLNFINNISLGKELCNSIANGGHFTPLNYYSQNDTISALFRLVTPAGINYHEYELIYNNGIEIVDVYILISGELFSQTIAQLIEPTLIKDDSILGKLKHIGSKYFGKKKQYEEDMHKIVEMRSAKATGNNKKVHELYESLSETSKSQKSIQIMNLLAVTQYDNELLIKAVENYKSSFPNDVSLDLILIDYYVVKEQYDEALNCLNNISAYSQNDGYVEYLKSNMFYLKGDIENFILCSKSCIQMEPWIEDPYYNLIQHYLETQSFKVVTDLLIKLRDNAGMIFSEESMLNNVAFSEFLKSNEYLNWKDTY